MLFISTKASVDAIYVAYVTVYMGDCGHHVVRVCDNMIFAHSRLSRRCDNVNNGLSVGLSTNRMHWSVGDEDICHLKLT